MKLAGFYLEITSNSGKRILQSYIGMCVGLFNTDIFHIHSSVYFQSSNTMFSFPYVFLACSICRQQIQFLKVQFE